MRMRWVLEDYEELARPIEGGNRWSQAITRSS